jgi:hypothetical protein
MKIIVIIFLASFTRIGICQEIAPERLVTLFSSMGQKEFKSRYTPTQKNYSKEDQKYIDGILEIYPTPKKMAGYLNLTMDDYLHYKKFNVPSEYEHIEKLINHDIEKMPAEFMAGAIENAKSKYVLTILLMIENPQYLCDIMYYVDEKTYDKIKFKLPENEKVKQIDPQ